MLSHTDTSEFLTPNTSQSSQNGRSHLRNISDPHCHAHRSLPSLFQLAPCDICSRIPSCDLPCTHSFHCFALWEFGCPQSRRGVQLQWRPETPAGTVSPSFLGSIDQMAPTHFFGASPLRLRSPLLISPNKAIPDQVKTTIISSH